MFWLLAFQDSGPTSRRSESRSASTSWLNRWIRTGAGFSYTLYLTHFSILALLYEWRDRLAPFTLVALALLVSNVAAWTLSWFGERHTWRLRAWARAHWNH